MTMATLQSDIKQDTAWHVWAEVEARLNELALGEPAERLAQAARFVWGSPNCPKHD